MFVYHCLLLFLAQLIHPSLQFELEDPAFPDCKEQSWLCIVNEHCHTDGAPIDFWRTVTEADKGAQSDRKSKCAFFIRIRQLEDGRNLVIVKSSLQEILLVSSNGATEHFGCKRNGDQIEQMVSPDTMELVDIASVFDATTERFTCAGYVVNGISDFMTLEVKARTVHSSKDYKAPAGQPAILMDKYRFCDQFQANAYAEVNQEYADFSDVTNFILPPSDKLPPSPCETGKTLYYREYFDSPSQPVHVSQSSFWCNKASFKYELQLIGKAGIVSPTHPFLLFCAANLNTKCLAPVEIPCEDCKKLQFKAGGGLTPAELTCPDNGFKVSGDGSTMEVVPGHPVCKRKDETGASWAIRPLNVKGGHDIFFSHATCHKPATCFGKQPLSLETECPEEDEDCTEPEIYLKGIFCPNGTTLRYRQAHDTKWIDRNKSMISCDSPPSWWPPVDNEERRAIYACFIDYSDAQRKGVEIKETQRIIAFVLLALFSSVIIALYFIWRRCKKKDKEREKERRKAESSKRDGTGSEGVVTSESKKTDKDITPLQRRMERYPGVDMTLLYRKDDTKELLFNDTLLGARADYISDRFKKEFEFYSIYERSKFAETMAHDMGHRTYIAEFFEIFMMLLAKETAFGVWDNLVQGAKMLAFSLRKRSDENNVMMLEHLHVVLYQFSVMYLPKVKSTPPRGGNEHENVSNMRALALYIQVFSLDKPTIDELMKLHTSLVDLVFPSLRKLVWSTVVRHDGKFGEIKEMLTKELAVPQNDMDTRFGSRREHLIYALCSTHDRDLAEPFLKSLIKEPQYTGKDLVAAFTGMVKDFDDCHDCARFVFTEKHKMIKEKIGIASEEYKKILAILSQFASESLSNEGWLVKFLEAEDTFTDEERKALKHEFKEAKHFRSLYLHLPYRCMNPDKRAEVNLRGQLDVYVRDFVVKPNVSTRRCF